jgi:uracil-DNA glycosylase
VFLLWGAYAQRKGDFVDGSRHLVLKAAHPSPLSAHNGFLGCRHFSKANDFLEAKGRGGIDWGLPDVATV